MLFVIIGYDGPDARETRARTRADHLAHLRPLAEAGSLKLAGPFLDGAGSLILLEADSPAEAWQTVAADPYVKAGVFERVEVRPFRQVLPEVEA